MVIENLHFFDSNGYNLNFELNSDLNYWEGSIYLPKVSVGIHASTSIYILEYFPTMENIDNSDIDYVSPYYFPKGSSTDKIKFTWDPQNKFVDEFFMFNFDNTYTLKETSALTYTPNDGPECETLIVNRFDEYNVPLATTYNSRPLPLHIAFIADEKYDATTYCRALYMSYKDKTIAKIKFFAETIEEDERLKIWNSNLGYKITPEDSMIFYKSDINEHRPDYKILNEKRKELMMEGSNIYPYVGSYKAIINAIKFFGYDNLGIIEYWKNVNSKDENFGKVYHSSRYSLTKKEILAVGARTIILPNKDYKKINKIALVYSINQPTGETDEWELPIVKENFTYTIEEALIKLFALRKKLNNEFMPGSSRIIDIIGEANYFGIQALSKSNMTKVANISETDFKVDFDIFNSDHIFLTDDRYFNRYIIDIEDTTPDSDYDPDENTEFNSISTILDKSILDIENERVGQSTNYSDLPMDVLCNLYKNYYNDVFVNHTRYETWSYDETDELTGKASAKIILSNTTFKDVTFDDSEISFGNKLTYWKYDSETKSYVYAHPDKDITFDNINVYPHLNSTCKWTITMSNNQIDDDLKNIGIEKHYPLRDMNGNIIDQNTLCDPTLPQGKKRNNYKTTAEGENIFIMLPYAGYYDVTLEIDGIKKTKRKFIKVETNEINIKGFYYDNRELPNNIKYDLESNTEMYEYIENELFNFINWARTEKTALNNLKNFSMPTFSGNDMSVINTGPYTSDNIISPWYLLDNISYDVSLLKPYVNYAKYIHNGVDIKPYTWILLTYNYSLIAGKNNPKWTITNVLTNVSETYVGKYFTCLMTEEGNYKIDLYLKDCNGNEYTTSRNIFVVSKTANYNIYQTFKKEYDNMLEDEQLKKTRIYEIYNLDDNPFVDET